MQSVIHFLVEILKISLPAFIVFLTVYHLMRDFFRAQIRMREMELKSKGWGDTLPLKIQAYERLSLFLERIRLATLMNRLDQGGHTVKSLRATLLIGIQQEFDHNVSQRLYVSESLWKIIGLARIEVATLINEMAADLPEEGVADYKKRMMAKLEELGNDPVEVALLAIKKEIATIL
jgi:hypothetical protein